MKNLFEEFEIVLPEELGDVSNWLSDEEVIGLLEKAGYELANNHKYVIKQKIELNDKYTFGNELFNVGKIDDVLITDGGANKFNYIQNKQYDERSEKALANSYYQKPQKEHKNKFIVKHKAVAA